MDQPTGTQEADAYAEVLGERLRNVRQQQGLSLHDVERDSEGELKASVVGAYERGERAVSVTRLRVLADFYRVPISELLPRGGGADGLRATRTRPRGLRIDLTRLETSGLPERPVVGRFVDTIRVRRGDYNGRMLTIRAADLAALAAVLDLESDTLQERLVGAGVAAQFDDA